MKRHVALILALSATLMLSNCGPSEPQGHKVGLVGPVTGQYAPFGAQMKNGAEMVVADINGKGGVLGKPILLTIADDACDPKQAVAVANKLASSKTTFVAGHFCSGSSIPASSIYADERIVQISPASTNPKLTDERAGPTIYRVCGRDDQQGGIAGAYLAANFGDKNIAIIHDKTAYGKGLADETRKAMNKAGKQETLYEPITAGEKDYSALVSKLKNQSIDILYIGGYHTEAGLIVRQMRDQGLNTILVGGDALVTQEYWSITGSAGAGTLMTFSPDPRKHPAAAELVKRFKEQNIDPEGYVLYTYAAIQAWAQAVETAGSLDVEKVTTALNTKEFDTVIGKFRFNEKGDPSLPPYAIFRWENGSYTQIN